MIPQNTIESPRGNSSPSSRYRALGSFARRTLRKSIRLNEYLSWYAQGPMQLPNHRQSKRAFPIQYLRYSASAAEVPLQVFSTHASALKVVENGFHGVGQGNRMMLVFVPLDQRRQDFEPACFRVPWLCIEKLLDLCQGILIVSLRSYWSYFYYHVSHLTGLGANEELCGFTAAFQ